MSSDDNPWETAVSAAKSDNESDDSVESEEVEGDSEDSQNPREATESISEGGSEVSPSEEDQIDSASNLGLSEDSDGPPTFANSLSLSEAADIDRRWKIMIWGPEKMYKSHFGFTMPEPIAYLDLEEKADDIAGKFSETKDVRIWQPKTMEAEPDTRFRRAKKCLEQAIEWLDWYRENEGRRGTIVVDSMSQMWEWAKSHHKIENYPMTDPEDIELSANFTSSQESDWAVVKQYHNGEFRNLITESSYHYYWTCMQREDFDEIIEGEANQKFYEPRGEPNNNYKVDTVIRARTDRDRGKVGDLIGSNYVDNVFVGLKKPEFPKVKEAIERIEEAEKSDEQIVRNELSEEIGVETIIDYDPQLYVR